MDLAALPAEESGLDAKHAGQVRVVANHLAAEGKMERGIAMMKSTFDSLDMTLEDWASIKAEAAAAGKFMPEKPEPEGDKAVAARMLQKWREMSSSPIYGPVSFWCHRAALR